MLCGSTKIKTQPRVNPSSADLSLRRLLRRPRPRALGSKFACFSPFFGLFDGCNHPQKGQKTQLRKEEGKRNPISLSLSLSLRETAAPTTRSTRSNARVDAIGVGSLFLPLSNSLSLSLSLEACIPRFSNNASSDDSDRPQRAKTETLNVRLFPSSLFLFSFEKRHPQGTPTKEGQDKNKKCVCV